MSIVARVLAFAAVLALVAPDVARPARSDGTGDGGTLTWGSFSFSSHGYLPHGLVGLARIDPTGALDRDFGRNGFALERAGEIVAPDAQLAVDGSGRAVVVTSAELRRYAVELTPDPSYGGPLDVPGGEFHPQDMALLPDGAPVVAGRLVSGQTPTVVVVRLRDDGSLDPGFGAAGVAHGPPCLYRCRLRLLSDGGVLVGADDKLFRLTDTGAPDRGFGDDGVVTLGAISTFDVAPGGEIVVVRALRERGIAVGHLHADGSPAGETILPLDAHDDGDFDFIRYEAVGDVELQGDGRLLVAATRSAPGDYEWCPDDSIAAVVAADDDTLERILVGPLGIAEHIVQSARTITASRTIDPTCGYDPVHGHAASAMRLAGDLTSATSLYIFPELDPPAVAIADAPAEGVTTGPDVHFRFDVTPGPQDEGDVVLRCSLDGVPWQPCGTELELRGLAPAAHVLKVRALGINSAPSDTVTRSWSVASPASPPPGVDPPAAAPQVPITAPPAVATRVRLQGRRLTIRAVPGTKVRIEPMLLGVRNGPRRLARRRGTVGAGALRRTIRLRRADRLRVRRALAEGRRPRLRIRVVLTAPDGTRSSRVVRLRLRA